MLPRRQDEDEFTAARGQRSDRIQSRLKPEQKERFEYAAALEGQSLSEFLIRSLEERAQRVLAEHEVMNLREAASQKFINLLANAPAPNAALQAAFEEHNREVKSR